MSSKEVYRALITGDIKWLDEHPKSIGKLKRPYSFAVRAKTLDSLNWLADHKYPINSDDIQTNLFDIDYADDDERQQIIQHDFDVIKWLDAHGYTIDDDVINQAAHVGALNVLKWVDELVNDDLLAALKGNQIETADWLYNRGLRYPDDTSNRDQLDKWIYQLIDRDQLTSLIWLYDHGVEFDPADLVRACEDMSLSISDWLDSIGIRGDDEDMQNVIGEINDEDIPEYLLWLYQHHYQIPNGMEDELEQIQRSRHKG